MMNAEKPLVSVIVPYYNNDNQEYLRACFGSVVQQTYSPIELIVVDDGSTEEAAAMLDMLQPEYGFNLMKQVNKGVSEAINTGLAVARGKYLSFMGADDYWALNKIQLQVDFLESAPFTIGACCSRGYYVFENDPDRPEPKLTRHLRAEELCFDSLLQRNCILAIGVMIRGEVLKQVGGFDKETALEDWDMWLRITEKYEMAFLPEPLAYYRRHRNNRSNRFDRKWYESVRHILDKWKDKRGYPAALKQLEISGINNLSRFDKSAAIRIALHNPRYAGDWLYWRGLLKVFVPSFFFDRKYK